jgi:cellobiose phosphorylase
MIAGREAATPGEAKNSWLTGTAAWTLVSGMQGLLGIVPEYAGLRINPCVPRGWESFRVVRRFRGTLYEIDVRNPDGAGHGVRCMAVDGRRVEGNLVEPQGGPGPVRVDVVLGAGVEKTYRMGRVDYRA